MSRPPHLASPLASSLYFVLAGALAAGCSMDTDVDPRFRNLPISNMSPLEAASWLRSNSGMLERERLVIRDEAAWAETWQQLTSNLGTHALPAVDFTQSTIVVAAMGRRNTGGYQILIEGAELKGESATFFITERSPGAGCGTGQALSEPTSVVVVERFEVEPTFVERSIVHDCR